MKIATAEPNTFAMMLFGIPLNSMVTCSWRTKVLLSVVARTAASVNPRQSKGFPCRVALFPGMVSGYSDTAPESSAIAHLC